MSTLKKISIFSVIFTKLSVIPISPYIYLTENKNSFAFYIRLSLGILIIIVSFVSFFTNRKLKYSLLKLVTAIQVLILLLILLLFLIFVTLFGISVSSAVIGGFYTISQSNCIRNHSQESIFYWLFQGTVVFLIGLTVSKI